MRKEKLVLADTLREWCGKNEESAVCLYVVSTRASVTHGYIFYVKSTELDTQ